ncbi:MAG: trypsin-like peptidase domain-containing protein [Chlamydiota bacterium]
MSTFMSDFKKVVVFLGRTNDKREVSFCATAIIAEIKNVFHLITAKHVVMDMESNTLFDSDLRAFWNSKGGDIASRSISNIKTKLSSEWIFHRNRGVDIAIIPFGFDEDDDIMAIPSEMFFPVDNSLEISDIFFLTYQPGIEPVKRIYPVIRSGIISLVNEDGTYYIDAAAFPGNSGSPVFLKSTFIKSTERKVVISEDPLAGKFIGVIGEYLPYQEIAVSMQTHRPRVIFEENTGLSRVWSVTFIKEIIESGSFQEQVDRLIKGGTYGNTSTKTQ